MTSDGFDGREREKGHRDYTGSKLGMWLFLATEVFFFAALFLLYAAYRLRYAEGFRQASSSLSLFAGTVNTAVLITSSLTAALSVAAIRRGRKNHSTLLLLTTVGLGAVFLVNKYFEWQDKFSHGIYPDSAVLAGLGGGESVFYGLYFFTTGMHALHVIGGVALLCLVAALVYTGRVDGQDSIRLENSVLYWHLVDVIWIYIFPLFYLIG
ncbi:MAG TPA: cytochrome c oxidase subunit 3 family protein [Thermodesulfobacteriota bacterium]|nr:cytochrome c oxidase subunit 3 family protein [Thermodesulfobacteriota bacterium]